MSSAHTYSKSQLDKLGNTLIYLCNHIKPISKTHILKLVFIIEEFSIKKFGIPFFDLRFDVWKLGPVSRDLFVELSGTPVLLSEFIARDDNNNEIIALKEFSDDEFSDNDIAFLNEILYRFLSFFCCRSR